MDDAATTWKFYNDVNISSREVSRDLDSKFVGDVV